MTAKIIRMNGKLKDSAFSSHSLARLIAAPVASVFATVYLAVLLTPLQRWGYSDPILFIWVRAISYFLFGFAFVFAGGLVAGRCWRVISTMSLLCFGILCFIYFHTFFSSDPFPGWYFVASIGGGLLAAGIWFLRKHYRPKKAFAGT